MRSTKNHRKAPTALVLGLVTAALFTATAPAQEQTPYLTLADETAQDSGYVAREFRNGSRVPDGYVGGGVAEDNISGGGVTPTNLDRAVEPGKVVEVAAVSASSDGFDRGDLAVGFGLGLILATAAAIALVLVRDRDHTQMAH